MPLAPQCWQALAPPAANVGLAVMVNGYTRTSELADRSLNVHVGTSGNSLGTADATFNDPAVQPVINDVLRVFVDTRELFEGRVKDVTVNEWKQAGGHVFVKVGAQDNGPDLSLPLTPPWGLSDTPNGTTTHVYTTAQKVTRSTEGGQLTTTVSTGIKEHGLWARMQVPFTSSLLGYAAVNLDIVDATLSFENKIAPVYRFELGQPLVSLAQLISSGSSIDPGSITNTQISDGAVTTPKLNTNAVIANLANIAGTVLINQDGVRVTGGALTVVNPGGSVIIDGSSDMFRIYASGSTSATGPANSASDTVVIFSGLGASGPLTLSTMIGDAASNDTSTLGIRFLTPQSSVFTAATSGGAVTQRTMGLPTFGTAYAIGSGGFAAMDFIVWNYGTGSSTTLYCRYYVLAQVAL